MDQVKVVVNDHGQHSTWPVRRPNPLGWHDLGVTGTREECLEHIARVWTDVAPHRAPQRAAD